MIWLLENWKLVITGLLVSIIAYGLHSLDVNRLEANQRAELIKQADTLNAECKTDKAITEGVSNVFQKSLTGLGNQFAAVSLQPSTCVAVQPSSTSAGHHAATTGEPIHKNGINASTLYNYAAEAEKYRLQLVGCQDFIRKTWAEKAQ